MGNQTTPYYVVIHIIIHQVPLGLGITTNFVKRCFLLFYVSANFWDEQEVIQTYSPNCIQV